MRKSKRLNTRRKVKYSKRKTKRSKVHHKRKRHKTRRYRARGGNPEDIQDLRDKLSEVIRVFNEHTHSATGRVSIGKPSQKITPETSLQIEQKKKRAQEYAKTLEQLRKEIIEQSYAEEKDQIEREQQEAEKQKKEGNLSQYSKQLLDNLINEKPRPNEGQINKILDYYCGVEMELKQWNELKEKVKDFLIKSKYSPTCVEIEMTRYLHNYFMDCMHEETHEPFERLYSKFLTPGRRNFIGRKIKEGDNILSMPELQYLKTESQNHYVVGDMKEKIQQAIDDYTF